MTQYDSYSPPFTPARPRVPGWQRMAVILSAIAVIVPLLLALKPAPTPGQTAGATAEDGATPPAAPVGLPAGPTGDAISPVFSPEVRHWAERIVAWAGAVGLDPNIAATIMQVESCGDPRAVSPAGAQGLFQVMPFHFAAGESALDPDTNARRGLTYYVERLNQTDGDIGRAFAGYNGGQRAAASGWEQWPAETQRYYLWTTGIYGDIQRGLVESPTLAEWMAAGGASLCAQAAARLGLGQ